MRSMYPRSIIDRGKLRDYLWAYHEREKFLKSIESSRYCDWVIHKKLLEERGKRVYTIIRRGNGKWATIDRYLDLLLEGKEVVVARRKDIPELVKPNKRFEDVIIDKDLYFSNPVNERFAEEIGEYVHKEFRKRLMSEPIKWETCNPYLMDWGPIVRHDSYIFDNKKYMLDPCWRFYPDGRIDLMEVSLIPNPETKGISDES